MYYGVHAGYCYRCLYVARSVCLSVLVTPLCCAKTDELIVSRFMVWTHVGAIKPLLDGVHISVQYGALLRGVKPTE